MQPIKYTYSLVAKANLNPIEPEVAARITLFEGHSPLCAQSIKHREVITIEIDHSGKVITFSCTRQLSKCDLSTVIESVKKATKKIAISSPKAVLSLLDFLTEKHPLLSDEAFVKALKDWAKLTLPSGFRPALLRALQAGNLEWVQRLIAKEHSLLIEENNISLLGLAIWSREFAIARLLFSKGAKLKNREIDPFILVHLLLGYANKAYIISTFSPQNSPPSLEKDLPEILFFMETLAPLLDEEKQTQFFEYFLKLNIYFDAPKLTLYLFSQFSQARKEAWLNAPGNYIQVASLKFILFFIEQGANKEDIFIYGASYGRKDVLAYLLENGVSINCTGTTTLTAIENATAFDQIDIVNFLLEKGASLHSLSRPPLYYATSEKCRALLKTKELPGFSDYYFRLLMFTHTYQIIYKAQDPFFQNARFEGVIGLPIKAKKPSEPIFSHWDAFTYCHITECVRAFTKGMTDTKGIHEIPAMLKMTSYELELRYQARKGILLNTSWVKHATYMWIEGHILLYGNTGERSEDKTTGLSFYYIPDPKKITPEVIEQLRRQDRQYIEHGIISTLDLKLLAVSPSKGQKGNFCGVRGLLLLFKGIMILNHMPKSLTQEEFIAHFETASSAIADNYLKAKNGVMDQELSALLDLYESEEFSFQPEIPLLLMAFAKLPKESTQFLRLFDFLKGKVKVEMQSKGANIFHYIKSETHFKMMESLFGKEILAKALPLLINATHELQPDTPLVYALDQNRFESAKLLLRLGADPLMECNNGDSGLKAMIRLDSIELLMLIQDKLTPTLVQELFEHALTLAKTKVIPFLLNAGANVNQENDGVLPIHRSCLYKDAEMTKLLLVNGADPLKRPEGRKTGLEVAIMQDRQDLVEAFLKLADQDLVQEMLFYAIESSKMQVIPILLNAGANINKADKDDFLPLSLACYANVNIAKVLLERGADPTCNVEGKKTPLQLAVTKDLPNFLELMLEFTKDRTVIQPLFLDALLEKKIHVIPVLLKAGANVRQEKLETPPLIYACWYPNSDIAELLLQHGALPNDHVKGFLSPLQLAIKEDRSDLVDVMLPFVSEQARSKILQKLLTHSIPKGNTEILSILIKAGADINKETKKLLPLHLACYSKNSEVAKLLIQNGADPFYRYDETAITGIEFAITTARFDILELMLPSMGNDQRPYMIQRLFEYALKFVKLNAVSWLLDQGADPNQPDSFGNHPLVLACNANSFEMLNLLLKSGANPIMGTLITANNPFLTTLNAIQRAAYNGSLEFLEAMFLALDENIRPGIAGNLLSESRIPFGSSVYQFLTQLQTA